MPFYHQEKTDRKVLNTICGVAQNYFSIRNPILDEDDSYITGPQPEEVLKAQGYIRGMIDAWDIFTNNSIELLPGGSTYDDKPSSYSSYRYKPHDPERHDEEVSTQ